MGRFLPVIAVCGVIASCAQPNPQEIAEEACPYITRIDFDDELRMLDVLVEAGMQASTASDRLEAYHRSLDASFGGTAIRLHDIERCEAFISNDQTAIERIKKTDREIEENIEQEMRDILLKDQS